MVTVDIFLFLSLCALGVSEKVPTGHLKPLGSHRPKEGFIQTLDYVPDPKDFYQHYVAASKAVIFKGAARISKGFQLWTDQYLRANYGENMVRVDYSKKENRYQSATNMSLADFLDIYNNSNVYLVDTLPHSMWHEISLPKCLLCGGYSNALQDSVLWFSSGGTKSHLHNDKVENINCLLSGHKTWFFVDLINSKNIVMDHQDGEFCSVNVDSVDMYKYPSLQDIPWWLAELEAGDCIYVPYGFQAVQVINDNGGAISFDKINSLVVRFDLLDVNKDGSLTEKELNSLTIDVIEEAFGNTPPGEVNLVGASRNQYSKLNQVVDEIMSNPEIEDFLLKPDKTQQDIEHFLTKHKNRVPTVVKKYLAKILTELDRENKNKDEL